MQHLTGNTLNQAPSYSRDKQAPEEVVKGKGRRKRIPSWRVEKRRGWA